MTKRHQIEIESVMLFILSAGIGCAFALYIGHKPQPPRVSLPVMQMYNSTPVLTTTPTPVIPKPQVTSQVSPDGRKQITMMVTTNNDLTKTYTFTTSDADGSNQQTIYSASYATDSMSIPFNTWSSDNKYVFLMHGNEPLVMRADGQPFTDTEKNFSVTTIFDAKNTGNVYQETTGWASNTLLIINTTTKDGSKGPSYWLEIPSKAVIQLSTQF